MTIPEYISQFPLSTQTILNHIYIIVKEASPDIEETISYGVPTFKIHNKNVIHFAAYKNHIGLYATPSGNTKFAKELSLYKQGKGSIQFALNQPIPFELIRDIIIFRIKETELANNK
jgi:uncharacterized protein YdhG (YjbR/CyaY superfamily)